MFIASYGNNVYEMAPSKTIWVFSWLLFNAFIYYFKY